MTNCIDLCINACCEGVDGIGDVMGFGIGQGVDFLAGPGAAIHTPTAKKVGKAAFGIGLGSILAGSVVYLCWRQAQ